MSDTEVGKILPSAQPRDAIHVAVASVISDERLYPGEHIGLIQGTPHHVSARVTTLGIVDPFLTHAVLPGEWFWMYLYPRTITGLKHSWAHPAFPEDPAPDGTLKSFGAALVANLSANMAASWDRPLDSPANASPEQAFVASLGKSDASYRWLCNYANQIDVRIDTLLVAAQEWLDDGEYFVQGGDLDGVSTSNAFWDHFQNYTGVKVPAGKAENFFSCSC